MDLREFRVVVRIVDRVAKRALFAEKQRVALEGQCAEWRRIADELKAETVTAESVIKELRTECDDLRRVFSLVHGSLGIQQGEHIGNAIDALKKERDCANAERARHEAQSRSLVADVLRLTAEIERLKKPARHPVKVGKSVRRTTEGSIAPIGTLGRVLVVGSDAYQVELRKGFSTMWAFDDCTPCDPPTASHDTPAGKETAQAAAEPKPGDVVRLEEDK